MGKKKIRSRCEMDTEDESYTYEGRFVIEKKILEVPLSERMYTNADKIVTYELYVERQGQLEGEGGKKDAGFSDCKIILDEDNVPEDILEILERYCEKRDTVSQ